MAQQSKRHCQVSQCETSRMICYLQGPFLTLADWLAPTDLARACGVNRLWFVSMVPTTRVTPEFPSDVEAPEPQSLVMRRPACDMCPVIDPAAAGAASAIVMAAMNVVERRVCRNYGIWACQLHLPRAEAAIEASYHTTGQAPFWDATTKLGDLFALLTTHGVGVVRTNTNAVEKWALSPSNANCEPARLSWNTAVSTWTCVCTRTIDGIAYTKAGILRDLVTNPELFSVMEITTPSAIKRATRIIVEAIARLDRGVYLEKFQWLVADLRA